MCRLSRLVATLDAERTHTIKLGTSVGDLRSVTKQHETGLRERCRDVLELNVGGFETGPRWELATRSVLAQSPIYSVPDFSVSSALSIAFDLCIRPILDEDAVQ